MRHIFVRFAAGIDGRTRYSGDGQIDHLSPRHISHVLPSIDERIRFKDIHLEQRGTDPPTAAGYALDFRQPVLLAGSPDVLAYRDILPWEGDAGERRKRELTIFRRQRVCSDELSLMRAQTAISDF